MPHLHQSEEEKFFLNARGQKETLPSIWDSPTKQLSVVVPSYNEEKRCKPNFIFLLRGHLGGKGNLKYGLHCLCQNVTDVGYGACIVGSCSSEERKQY